MSGIRAGRWNGARAGRRAAGALAVTMTVTMAVLAPAAAQAQAQYQELHNFYPPTDGSNPDEPGLLAQGLDGNLYGTLPFSGGTNSGTAFVCAIGAAGSCSSFTPTPFPQVNATSESGLSLAFDGTFYGTTERGGTYGTLFHLSNGTLTTLYQFQNAGDGAYPWAPPVQALDGNLYGVTTNGNNRPGTVYRISPAGGVLPGQIPVIGTVPETGTQQGSKAPLVLGGDGNLYGTTPYGGSASCANGSHDGGTVFRVTTAGGGAVTTLYCFDRSAANGGIPLGPVLWGADGMLYGTTASYGAHSQGVVYRLDPNNPAAFTVLHHFSVADGTSSSSGLVQGSDGMLYGVQSSGGSGSGCGAGTGCGTLYRVDPTKVDQPGSPNVQVLHNFDRSLYQAGNPQATPLLHTNGKIYGVSHTGGSLFNGTGVLYGFDAGLKPFALITPGLQVHVGDMIVIRGQGFLGTTGVQFGTNTSLTQPRSATDTAMWVQVPSGACTGHVTVHEPGGNLATPQVLTVLGLTGRPVPCITRPVLSLP